VEQNGPLCGCGQRGCLELYVSGSGIARMWPVASGDPPTALAQACQAGDEMATAVYSQVVAHLAWVVQLLAVSLDVERVLLSGGVANLGQTLLRPLHSQLRAQASQSPFVASLKLSDRVGLASTGPLGAVGAARFGELRAAMTTH
jgi:predicted NBD/HSP70 family sugar kinase